VLYVFHYFFCFWTVLREDFRAFLLLPHRCIFT